MVLKVTKIKHKTFIYSAVDLLSSGVVVLRVKKNTEHLKGLAQAFLYDHMM